MIRHSAGDRPALIRAIPPGGAHTMNTKTAQHLNELLKQSKPLLLTDKLIPHGGTEETRLQLQERLQPIFKACMPEVIRQEIMEAAKEKRQAETNAPEFTCFSWEHYRARDIPWKLTKRLWWICEDQIRATVKAINASSQCRYEGYRLACEQGVAIPPSDDE
jgi:dGTP triphosphohydrolase